MSIGRRTTLSSTSVPGPGRVSGETAARLWAGAPADDERLTAEDRADPPEGDARQAKEKDAFRH
ncbi:hypothetical protein [Streptomyces sp. NPDC088746]|uniref:hypothetical protein n=1 Tax=Streptomyces sp. NPDC088746 TaxID=3365885 RepID=UPI0037FE39E1